MSKEIRLARLHELLAAAGKDNLLCNKISAIRRAALGLLEASTYGTPTPHGRQKIIDAYPSILKELAASLRDNGSSIQIYRPVDDRGSHITIAFILGTTDGDGFSILIESVDQADIQRVHRRTITARSTTTRPIPFVEVHEMDNEHFKFAQDALNKIIPNESELPSDMAVAGKHVYNLYDMGKYVNSFIGHPIDKGACTAAAEYLILEDGEDLITHAKSVAWDNVAAELQTSKLRRALPFKFIHPASNFLVTAFFNLSMLTRATSAAIEVLIEVSKDHQTYERALIVATLSSPHFPDEVVVYSEDSEQFRSALTRLPKDLGAFGEIALSLSYPLQKATPPVPAAPTEASPDEGSSFSERYAANNVDLEVPAFEGKGPEEKVAQLLGNRDDIYETRLNYMPGALVAHMQHARGLHDDAIGRLALSPRYLEPADLHNVTELVREEAVLRFHFDKLREAAQERSTVRNYEDMLPSFMENYAAVVFAASAIANIIRVTLPAAEKLASVNSVFMPRQ